MFLGFGMNTEESFLVNSTNGSLLASERHAFLFVVSPRQLRTNKTGMKGHSDLVQIGSGQL